MKLEVVIILLLLIKTTQTYLSNVQYYGLFFRAESRAEPMHIFRDWHRSFHGTQPQTIKAILESGNLFAAGEPFKLWFDVTMVTIEIGKAVQYVDEK